MRLCANGAARTCGLQARTRGFQLTFRHAWFAKRFVGLYAHGSLRDPFGREAAAILLQGDSSSWNSFMALDFRLLETTHLKFARFTHPCFDLFYLQYHWMFRWMASSSASIDGLDNFS